MKYIRYSSLFAFALFLCGITVHAASLSISPQSGTYIVGSIVSLDVIVESDDTAINAVSGTIAFPSSVLEPISITRTDSLITLWIQKPSVTTGKSEILFEGLVQNPGFRGTGKIATILFRVIKQGSAQVSFKDGLVLANDGQGTNVLNTFSDASLIAKAGSLGEGTELPDEVAVDDVGVEDIADHIRPPVITQYSRSVARLDELFLQGITYPDAEVNVWLQREADDPSIRGITSDAAGNFVYIHGRDGNGRDSLPARAVSAAFMPFITEHYYFWTSVVKNGVESTDTQIFDVAVGGLGGFDISPLALIIGALTIGIGLLILGILIFILVRGRKNGLSKPDPWRLPPTLPA